MEKHILKVLYGLRRDTGISSSTSYDFGHSKSIGGPYRWGHRVETEFNPGGVRT